MAEVHMDQQRTLGSVGGDRRFELLVNAIKDYAIYLLDRDGHVAGWNAGAERFKGVSGVLRRPCADS